jgi:hypothetical protein
MPEEKIRGLSVLFHLKLTMDLVLPNDSSGSAPEERTQRKHLWGRPQLADDLSLNLANTLTINTHIKEPTSPSVPRTSSDSGFLLAIEADSRFPS